MQPYVYALNSPLVFLDATGLRCGGVMGCAKQNGAGFFGAIGGEMLGLGGLGEALGIAGSAEAGLLGASLMSGVIIGILINCAMGVDTFSSANCFSGC
jgi:hypothetical protein